MPDVDTYWRIVLRMETYFTKTGENQLWSLKMSITGHFEATGDEDNASAACQNLWTNCFAPLCSTRTNLVGASVYPAGSNTAAYIFEYTAGSFPGSGAAYTGPGAPQQLEVCAMLEANVGKSSTNKPVFLRKHVHEVQGSDTTPGNLDGVGSSYMTGANATFADVGTTGGAVCDPRNGTVPAEWVLKTPLYTRQLRKGVVRKTG